MISFVKTTQEELVNDLREVRTTVTTSAGNTAIDLNLAAVA